MIDYKIVNQVNGALISKAIKPVLNTTPMRGKKYTARKKIHDDVFDLNDSVADNSKMITLLTHLVSKMYEVMPTNTKSKLSDKDKELLDYVSSSFDIEKTHIGTNINKDMNTTIDKLYGRQYLIKNAILGKSVSVNKDTNE